ncbi:MULTISPECIES: SpoIIE family protein phosphatase [unclassified Ectothiorhodospira]|uniref:SpoIIE family protein phosphatase n=1 Tax=unclassified Ectothiorhodospira TaxID=2684909 RepID=UPI001EE78B14|nr:MULTISPECIES: SpoIIE family protein phosphatase [unclassified Ectothiorhodospira]MCG5516148.1 SpoIIE family protein phosphatase [Ectothiorhodospira sp. 9100]MCG5518615.1 SpoIIE family protein phosphatase [Ectothiorhodospira sp. 9905]
MSPDAPPRSSPGPENPASAIPVDCRGLALVVDDEPTNRRLLARMLKKEGFETLEAESGSRAIELFEQSPPDIVFMDVMMPGMDGFEATRRIKAMAGFDFVPVIFLTALHDEKSLVQCTESGGDDFLTKPFNFSILKARITAMERVRDLQRIIAGKNRELENLLEQDRQEQKLAERVFNRAVNDRNVRTEQFGLVQRPATTFNGDLVLTQDLPDGGVRILLGDFTGHGLAAAIGALPVAETFRTMTRKGVDDEQVLDEINRKLYRVLPPERFMAACLISLPGSGREIRWWNGGMPSAWLRNREGFQELASHALPLGILPELSDRDPPRRVAVRRDDRLLMMSDGLLEARNPEGQMFIDHGFSEVLNAWSHGEAVLPGLLRALEKHCADQQPEDDIAILEAPLDPELFSRPPVSRESHPQGGWNWSLTLEDERLGDLPSLESALRPLGLLDGLEEDAGPLETIVNELYSNALEHGVLQLSSRMKADPEGFCSYYLERGRRLAEGCQGRVDVSVTYEPDRTCGVFRVRISDSGPGFDASQWEKTSLDTTRPWGRGIALVRDLCETVVFDESGSRVEAVYRCR